MVNNNNLILLVLTLFYCISSATLSFINNYGEAIHTNYTNTCNIPNALQMSNAETVKVKIETFDGSDFTIIWDDTTSVKVNSLEEICHTYDLPYSGKVRFEELNGMQVKSIEISGGFAFDIQQLYGFAPKIESIISNENIQCYGDVASKPTSLIYIDLQIGNFCGHFNKDRLRNVKRLRIVDGNTVSFDIADFDNTINYIGVTGMNTATGLLDSLNYPSLHHFDVKGMNSISGDLGNINTPLLSVFYLGGNNTSSSYSAGNLNISSNPQIFIYAGLLNTLSTADIDALLIDLDNVSTTWSGARLLILTGAHSTPSDNSLTARSNLEMKGANVFTN